VVDGAWEAADGARRAGVQWAALDTKTSSRRRVVAQPVTMQIFSDYV